MNNTLRFVAAFVIATSSLALGSGAAAQEKSQADDSMAKVTDLNSFLCKDVMRMSGDERIISLSLLNGYFLGKKATTRFVPGSMGKASDDFTEYCLDHPEAKALDAFAKFAK